MKLLKKAQNEQAYLKMGAFGDTGSGKTTTLGLLALGISKTYCKGAPVAMMDTERAADFLLPIFQTEGVELLVHKSRAFRDQLAVLKEAQDGGCCALIVDSVTHTWAEIQEAYRHKLKVKRLQFEHWAEIKRVWGEWTDAFLTSPIHIMVSGRAGYEYEYQLNEETQKKELIKGDTKMRTEGQFGYEPSLLVEMERVRVETTGKHRGGSFMHVAHVLKDRSWALNGKELTFGGAGSYKKGAYKVVFDAFSPHLAMLNIGGAQQAPDTSTSEALFDRDGSSDWTRAQRAKAIALEEIQQTFALHWPGQDAASKKLRIRLIETIFGCRGWTAVEAMHAEQVERGLSLLRLLEAEGIPVEEEGVLAAIVRLRDHGPAGYTPAATNGQAETTTTEAGEELPV